MRLNFVWDLDVITVVLAGDPKRRISAPYLSITSWGHQLPSSYSSCGPDHLPITVGEYAAVRGPATGAHWGQQRTLKPSPVLVAALKIEVCGNTVLRPSNIAVNDRDQQTPVVQAPFIQLCARPEETRPWPRGGQGSFRLVSGNGNQGSWAFFGAQKVFEKLRTKGRVRKESRKSWKRKDGAQGAPPGILGVLHTHVWGGAPHNAGERAVAPTEEGQRESGKKTTAGLGETAYGRNTLCAGKKGGAKEWRGW